ncbi:phenylalanine-4-hydroxylase [Advenella kashmirensis W13003]|uniref:phenylalanine 4-monooxygenase n=1 Tax=Advenella kashmirensis W13003 TaxID=1424334 RepID=V8QND4_9BURK|nr:phenylalanine 4-monooxygenase [Advenella kashmirensis]ETF00825.1 phenylalanine-4-hydroxylase [Advenella kashmirensis W13003]
METLKSDPVEKHGSAAQDAAAPSPDWTINQNWEAYTAEEHGVWKTLYERQTRLLPGRVCDQYLDCIKQMPITADEIPDFRRVNDLLMKHTGWQIVAVPGLVPDEVFFTHIANRRFPAGQFIRSKHKLDYLQEPDIFHDVFGHAPMLMNPAIADFMQAYGQGGLKALERGILPFISRLYWYTIEFGLVQQKDGIRIYGAGISSSFTESQYCLEDESPHRLGFDLERVMLTDYRIDDLQKSYFVLDDLDDLFALAQIDFDPIYERICNKPAFAPDQIVTGDRVLHTGTLRYHREKAAQTQA